jgi:hypothetical protein
MKKSLMVLVTCLFVLGFAALSFSQTQAQPGQRPAHPSGKVILGTVDAVTAADPAKATKSEIVIVDKTSAKQMFLVKPTTTIYDAKGNSLTLNKVAKGSEVRIRFTTTAEGVNEAASIRVMK